MGEVRVHLPPFQGRERSSSSLAADLVSELDRNGRRETVRVVQILKSMIDRPHLCRSQVENSAVNKLLN